MTHACAAIATCQTARCPGCLQAARLARSSAGACALAPPGAAKPMPAWASSVQRRSPHAQLMAALAVSGQPVCRSLFARVALPRLAGASLLSPQLLLLPPFVLAGCPSGQVKCGSGCVSATQCCKSDPSVGLKCTAPQECGADGGQCGECAVSADEVCLLLRPLPPSLPLAAMLCCCGKCPCNCRRRCHCFLL